MLRVGHVRANKAAGRKAGVGADVHVWLGGQIDPLMSEHTCLCALRDEPVRERGEQPGTLTNNIGLPDPGLDHAESRRPRVRQVSG